MKNYTVNALIALMLASMTTSVWAAGTVTFANGGGINKKGTTTAIRIGADNGEFANRKFSISNMIDSADLKDTIITSYQYEYRVKQPFETILKKTGITGLDGKIYVGIYLVPKVGLNKKPQLMYIDGEPVRAELNPLQDNYSGNVHALFSTQEPLVTKSGLKKDALSTRYVVASTHKDIIMDSDSIDPKIWNKRNKEGTAGQPGKPDLLIATEFQEGKDYNVEGMYDRSPVGGSFTQNDFKYSRMSLYFSASKD